MRNPSRVSLVALALAASVGCNGAEPPTAPNAQPVGPEVSPPAGPAAIGVWRKTRYDVTGTVQFVATNGVGQLTFSADFSVAQTPGPVVYVNITNNPNTGQPLRIGAIKSTRGAQTYTFQLPPGVRYTWVLIWCDPFNVPMAEAAINPTP